MMVPLNLPNADLRLSRKGTKLHVRCLIRRKDIVLTPEEWVRQHLIYFLIHHKGIPEGRIAVEMSVTYNSMQRRCDIVVFNAEGAPVLIAEVKAPEIVLSDETFHQIAQYNFALNVDTLLVSNGMEHVVIGIDRQNGQLNFLNDIPENL